MWADAAVRTGEADAPLSGQADQSSLRDACAAEQPDIRFPRRFSSRYHATVDAGLARGRHGERWCRLTGRTMEAHP
jgi:hypothetical protein